MSNITSTKKNNEDMTFLQKIVGKPDPDTEFLAGLAAVVYPATAIIAATGAHLGGMRGAALPLLALAEVIPAVVIARNASNISEAAKMALDFTGMSCLIASPFVLGTLGIRVLLKYTQTT